MIGRVLLSLLFLVAGSLHFIAPQRYLAIMPPYLPAHLAMVYLSGAAEILGGLGLFLPTTRHAAAWGLAALLIAVLPANIYMAMIYLPLPGVMGQSWAQWLRIPLQIPLIYWAWLYTRSR
ncbi:DoxX family protein [Granulicella sp. S190]|uniref:DoxX family protein n=1 Tax=Granulicella sp. S190 TaxID=1747226 RepID=UPI00131C006B|nr:DoxX family protein [Granulicella sp. S190]